MGNRGLTAAKRRRTALAKRAKHTTLFVAVVINDDMRVVSDRRDGDYSCFVGKTRATAIAKALKAKSKWDGYLSSEGEEKTYRVVVGKLDSEAAIAYNETKL